MKRHALDSSDQTHPQRPKRPRSASPAIELASLPGGVPHPIPAMASGGHTPEQQSQQQYRPIAPSPIRGGSVPAAGYPTQRSPEQALQPHMMLPSPSMSQYVVGSFRPAPASSGAGLPPPFHHLPSPTTSIQAPSSIHTVSTSSATSTHIADLQHQVTLKTLALQTLQSEYSSLLQKLQRERTKINVIEKKTAVAEEELNALTTRNEDLAEQVKELEVQLQEAEEKREESVRAFGSEKAQWVRMLDMGARLQSKSAEQWAQEKSRLLKKIEELGELRGISRPQQGVPNSYQPPSQEPEVSRMRDEIRRLSHHIHSLQTALRQVRDSHEAVQRQMQGILSSTAQVQTLADEALRESASIDSRLGVSTLSSVSATRRQDTQPQSAERSPAMPLEVGEVSPMQTEEHAALQSSAHGEAEASG